MAEPPLEPGWYRLTQRDGRNSWERVPDADAETEVAAGGGWDLVRVDTMAAEAEVPLF